MAKTGEKDAHPSPRVSPEKRRQSVLLRNAVRYSLSPDEHEQLQRQLRAYTPTSVFKRLPFEQPYLELVRSSEDYTTATIRTSLRIFLISQLGLKTWEAVKTKLLARGRQIQAIKHPYLKSPNFRLSLSLSGIFLLHRLLYRFFLRLRSNLLSKDAKSFRRRNPRITRSLTSTLAPAIGASLAGFTLAAYPADQLRLTIAIYFSTRSLEFLYDALEGQGWFSGRPKWWGSWMLTPLATGQLLHAFVFDRDCVPDAYTSFILKNTPNYIQKRPPGYPPQLQWPSSNDIVDGLKEMSNLSWPSFISPILFPKNAQPLPSTLNQLSPITAPAHPAHTALSCATLHPSDPSCVRTSANYFLGAFPAFAKFFAAFYALFSIPRYRKLFADPTSELHLLAKKVIRTATFVTGAIGTSWASICFFQYLLPRTFLPKSRWFLGGAMGGLWAYVDRQAGRGQVMYSVRSSIDSFWKVGKKRGWWRGVQGGDVFLFTLSLALMNVVYEKRKQAVDRGFSKGLGWMRGEELFHKKRDGEKKAAQ